MARQRSEAKKGLPPNLYMNTSGYYWYRNKNTGKTFGLGKDRRAAITIARQANMALMEVDDARINRLRSLVTGGKQENDGLLSEEFLRSSAKSKTGICGVYILMRDGIVVYVGQSVNCHKRIADHTQQGEKNFDASHIIECKQSDLDELEAQYIRKFAPEYNVAIPAAKRNTAWGLHS